MVSALMYEGEVAISLLAHSLSLTGMMICYAAVARRPRSLPFSMIGLMIALSALQPGALILAAWLGNGQVTYSVAYGIRSHHVGAPLVAAVQFVSVVAMTAVELLRPTKELRAMSWEETLRPVPSWVYGVMGWASLSYCAVRLVLLLVVDVLEPATAYVLRLYVGLLVGAFFFVGIRARQSSAFGFVVSGATVLTSMVALVGGNRGDAMLPLIVLGAGYVVARPMRRAQLLRWGIAGAAVFIGMLYIGSALRADERGRTADALLARLDNLGDTVSEGVKSESATESTVVRLLRGGTHAVINDIPGEVPYERDGIIKMPGELLERLLPQWNLTGRSDTGARNWMLNELGFLVNWSTSVELSLVADGWYRDGVLGVVLVSLLAATMLRLVEAFLTRRMVRRPEYIVPLVFAAAGVYMVEGRDFIWGLRTILFLVITAELVLLASTRLGFARKARVGAAQLGGPVVR
jgi:hypothetical protein